MTDDEIDEVCGVVSDADDQAIVVISPLSEEDGGHVTVVHHEWQQQIVDEALARAGLRSERINHTRTKVFGGVQ